MNSSILNKNDKVPNNLVEIKCIFKSFLMPPVNCNNNTPRSKFANSIKSANDSDTFNSSFEVKSIQVNDHERKINCNILNSTENSIEIKSIKQCDTEANSCFPSKEANNQVEVLKNGIVRCNNEVIENIDHEQLRGENVNHNIKLYNKNENNIQLKETLDIFCPVNHSNIENDRQKLEINESDPNNKQIYRKHVPWVDVQKSIADHPHEKYDGPLRKECYNKINAEEYMINTFDQQINVIDDNKYDNQNCNHSSKSIDCVDCSIHKNSNEVINKNNAVKSSNDEKSFKFIDNNDISIDHTENQFLSDELNKTKSIELKSLSKDNSINFTQTKSLNKPIQLIENENTTTSTTNYDHFGAMTNSTPLKSTQANAELLNVTPINSLINLLTPPSDATFIDSDFESMDNDQYDSLHKKYNLNTLIENDFSSSSSLVSTDRSNKTLSDQDNTTIVVVVPTKATVKRDTKIKRSNKVHQLPISKRLHQCSKNVRVLNFLTKKRKDEPKSNKEDNNNDIIIEGSKINPLSLDDHYENDLGVSMLLTSEHVEHIYSNEPDAGEWHNHLDYSFVCEPSSSDIEYDLNSSNDSILEEQEEDMCMQVQSSVLCRIKSDKCSFAKKTSIDVLRRSISDPNNLLNADKFVDANLVEQKFTNEATVKFLDTFTVSLNVYFKNNIITII